MFGGSPREDARENLARVLGIGTLEWPDSSKVRRVDALTSSISNGKVDAILLIRQFVSHMDVKKVIDVAKDSRTPFALVESGYGVAAVRTAIEEALQGAFQPG
jgi:hypothetical protein